MSFGIETVSEAIVKQICEEKSETWPNLLASYSWKGSGAGETFNTLGEITSAYKPVFLKVRSRSTLSLGDHYKLTEFALKVFSWGGVTYRNNDMAKSIGVVERVLLHGLEWSLPIQPVPMNSGWTKVAALGTDFVEIEGGTPQVIFDSRVAASLLTRLDGFLMRKGLPLQTNQTGVLPLDVQDIGSVPGRGGSRANRGLRKHQYVWPNRYKKWSGQFAASRLVAGIKDHLNANLGDYGLMPFSKHPEKNGRFEVLRWSCSWMGIKVEIKL